MGDGVECYGWNVRPPKLPAEPNPHCEAFGGGRLEHS